MTLEQRVEALEKEMATVETMTKMELKVIPAPGNPEEKILVGYGDYDPIGFEIAAEQFQQCPEQTIQRGCNSNM